jgi:hypothetical protein
MVTRYGRKMPVLSRFAIYALLPGLACLAWLGAGPAAWAADQAGKSRGGAESVIPTQPPVAMSVADCQRLLARLGSGDILHRPDPGVTYQPGRDVDSQGRPIAPADLPGSNPLPLDRLLTLDVKIPLSTLMGSDRTPPKVGESELHVTQVTVDPMNGQLMFDGQPLEGREEDAVAAACRRQLRLPATH